MASPATPAFLTRRQGTTIMLLFLLAALLCCSLLMQPTAASPAAKSSSSSSSAFDKYYAKMVKSQTGLLELDDGAFDAMLLKPGAKRSFPVLVFFTATNPKYSCQPCHMIGDALAYVAQSYALTNARKSAEHKLPPVIFAIADVDTAPQTVHEHIQLQTVPHLYLFPGNEALTLPPTEAEEMHLSPDDEGLAAFLEELEDRLGLTIPPVPDTTFTIQVAVAAALVLAVAVYLLLDQWTWVKGLPYRRGLWLTFSYCVFGTATGGMVYCVIREPPPFGVYQKKLHLFAMRQSSDQFVAEGLVMGGIQLFAGLSFVATYAFASKTRNRLVQFVGVNLSLAAAFYFLHRLFGLYAEKTKWYQVNATLDPLVSVFFFGNMKKGSGLFRRLCRATQLWLYEYKDWGNYRRTAVPLVVNYVRRTFVGKLWA